MAFMYILKATGNTIIWLSELELVTCDKEKQYKCQFTSNILSILVKRKIQFIHNLMNSENTSLSTQWKCKVISFNYNLLQKNVGLNSYLKFCWIFLK